MKRRYAALMTGLSLLAPIWLKHRVKAGKEDLPRLSERYGQAEKPRPMGTLIWMHGASVGETKTLLPVVERLLATDKNRHILVTSGTLTSAKLMEDSLPDRALHQYLPLDAPHYVRRFLDHWQPNLAVWMESEIWPNLIFETHARSIPMALINARMNPKSLRGWDKRRRFAKPIFDCFDIILPSDTQTADWLSQLLDTNILVLGNLKYDAPTLPFDAQEVDALKEAMGNRPLWTVASLHAEEMQTVITAQKSLKHSAGLILVPRHPSEATSRMIIADHPDLRFAIRSKGQKPTPQTDIYLFDTFGEMGLAYRLGTLALVGGSLDSSLLGHNPLEPIRLDIPTVTGPYFSSFAEVYQPFIENNAIVTIAEPQELTQIIGDMLNKPDMLENLRRNAQDSLTLKSGILDRTVASLETLLTDRTS